MFRFCLLAAAWIRELLSATLKKFKQGLRNGQLFVFEGVSHDLDIGNEKRLEYIQTQIRFLSGEPVELTGIKVPFEFDRIAEEK